MDVQQTLQRLNVNTTIQIDLEYKSIESLQTIMTMLAKFTKLKELNLHGNRLKQLPEDMSQLKTLESIDLSNNLFLNINQVVSSLLTLTSLVSLNYPVSNKEEENFIKQNMPKLQFLNNKQIKKYTDQENENTVNTARRKLDVTLKQEDLENMAIQFDAIRDLFRTTTNPKYDLTLQNMFHEHLGNVMKDLHLRMNSNTPDILANTYVLKAKYALQELCFSQIIAFTQISNPQTAQILQTIHDQHAQIFKDLTGLIQNNKDINQENGHEQDHLYQNFKIEIQRLQQDNMEQQQTIQVLELENKKFLDMLIRYSKGDKHAINQFKRGNDINETNDRTPHKDRSDSFGNIVELRQAIATTPPRQTPYQMSAGQSQVDITLPTRTLSMKQIKDVIFEIYESKSKFDQKYIETKQPRETMENHMYNFLNQKYGLKNLIIEWASAIINGIKKYSHEDNDIAVFGKILRNECDEEFRLVQARVKNTIQELLKMYIRGKHPLKHQSEVKDLLQQKIVGWVTQEEALDIVKYMYNQEDSESLIDQMKPHFVVQSYANKKLSREEQLLQIQEKEKPKIEYWLFQKLILDFQLRSHEKYLRRFIQLYRTVDQDHNGVINEPQFRQLTHMMNIELSEVEIQKFLNIIDPYDQQSITFSQCVTLFSSETVLYGKAHISILQKISIDF